MVLVIVMPHQLWLGRVVLLLILTMVIEVTPTRHGDLGADVHRLKFLEQQFARVRQMDFIDAVTNGTVLAPAGPGQQPTFVAHVGVERVGRHQQSFNQ